MSRLELKPRAAAAMDASHRNSPLSKRRRRPGFSPSPLSPSLSPQASSVRPPPAASCAHAPTNPPVPRVSRLLGKFEEEREEREKFQASPSMRWWWWSRGQRRGGGGQGVKLVEKFTSLSPQASSVPRVSRRLGKFEEERSRSFNKPRARRPPRGMEVEALPAAGAAAELGGGALGELADGDLPELRPGGAEPALPPAPAKAVSRRQSLTDITNRDHDADLAPPCGGDPPPPPEDLAPPAMAPGQVSSPSPPRPAGSCAPPRERTVHGRGRDEVEGGERPALHIEARSTTPRGRCPRPPRSSPSGSALLGGEPSAKALCPPATPAQWGLTR